MQLEEFLNRDVIGENRAYGSRAQAEGQLSEMSTSAQTSDSFETDEAKGEDADEIGVDEASENIDVQKAVVESLAADKAECDEKIADLKKENATLQAEKDKLQAEKDKLQSKVTVLNEQIASLKESLGKMGDILAKNSEGECSSKVALLERNSEIDDKFVGETHDHLLEIIKDSRDQAEKEGRFRRAQILESVLVVNEPTGELAKRRTELTKLFNENGNILSGTVIAELEKKGISYKNGEDYLLCSEIVKRTY